MTPFETRLQPHGVEFARNREAMLAKVAQWRAVEARAVAASEASRPRFEQRGQLLPRERVALLVDAGAPFIPLASVAGHGLDTQDLERSVAGGGVVAGIGVVSGMRVMVSASDSGINAGALQPMGLEKKLRIQELALRNKLPLIQLVESAGANLMAYRVEDFVRGGQTFVNLARLSAAGLPVITVTHGASTAGGAYQTGLADHVVMVRGRSRAFLAGPALLKAATGEVASEEELGGADMHSHISGLAEHVAEDDREALAIARRILALMDWPDRWPDRGQAASPSAATASSGPAFEPPRHSAEELLGIMPADPKQAVDMREVIARLVDGSQLLEFSPNYGPATVCANARIEGQAVGFITNNGPIDPAGANKATHFIQLCCQAGTPLVYLHHTTGYMVGRAYEEAGMIKHGSKMIQAVTNANVPQIAIHCGASFGAGNYGMCGRGFAPRFAFSWPNASTAVMGPEQAAGTMVAVQEAIAARKGLTPDAAQLQALKDKIVHNFERQMGALYTSARLLDDGLIDPRDTRPLLAELLRICTSADARVLRPVQFGVARP